MTTLKSSFIFIAYTTYTITEFLVCKHFFEKAQYSLEILLKMRTREPYLSSVFNSAREEFVENGINKITSFGKF